MNIKEQVIERISLLPPSKLKEVKKFLDSISFSRNNGKNEKLSKNQKRSLDLLNYTIETGITDLARNHDKYLYKRK